MTSNAVAPSPPVYVVVAPVRVLFLKIWDLSLPLLNFLQIFKFQRVGRLARARVKLSSLPFQASRLLHHVDLRVLSSFGVRKSTTYS